MTVVVDSGLTLFPTLEQVANVVKNTPSAKRQIVCTRGVFPNNFTAGNGASTRYESHLYCNSGEAAFTALQLHYAAMRGTESEDVIANVNPFNLQASVTLQNVSFATTNFNGRTTAPIDPAGTPVSNTIGVYYPANSILKIKTGAIVATAGLSIPSALPQTLRTKKVCSTDTVSQIFDRFDINNNGGRVDTPTGFFPVMITGIPEFRHVAIAGWGDSLMQGTGDNTNNSNGAIGWFEHACMNVDGAGRNIPFTNLSRAGARTTTYSDDTSFARFACLEYATHVIFGVVNNDIAAGRTLAQMQAAHIEAWAHARLHGVKIGVVTATPRTTSTDNWATVAGQTPVAGYTNAEIRGQFNNWLREQLALGVIDFIIDVDSVVRDETNPDVFKAGFSYDGIHWGAPQILTVANFVKTELLKLTV